MRNLISFAVACLVVACLALLPESGVRAEVFPGGGDGRGGEVGGDGPERGVDGGAMPTVTIDTQCMSQQQQLDAAYIHIDFNGRRV